MTKQQRREAMRALASEHMEAIMKVGTQENKNAE